MTPRLPAPPRRPRGPLAAAALAAALAHPAPALDLSAMSPEETAAFGAAVRAYLLANPEVLLEAVEVLNARQAAAQDAADQDLVAANAAAIFDDGFSWVGGNPEGDVTVVEFLDYRCRYCRQAHETVWELIETDGNIRFIVKEFPILGPQSELAARFAVATLQAAGGEAYGAVHHALMEMDGNLTPAALGRLAEALGLDSAAILERLNAPEVTEVIEATRALGHRLQINGTPTFVIGARMVRGMVAAETMRELVAAARAE